MPLEIILKEQSLLDILMRWVRYVSFCGAGFFAGVAGALFAINYEILTEQNLNLNMSFQVLLATYIGGVGFFLGPIFGAILFTILQTVIGLQTDLWALIYRYCVYTYGYVSSCGVNGSIRNAYDPYTVRKGWYVD